MKRCAPFTLAAMTLAALLAGLNRPAAAQTPSLGDLSNLNFSFNPAMFGMPAQVGGFVDPLHSAVLALLKRDDVRSQIQLTARQRESLDALEAKASEEMKTTVQAGIREGFQELQNVSPEELLTKVQEKINRFQDTVQNFQIDQDKKIETILKPAQLARLHELDLQWRGPLALSDKKVAEPYKLTPDQKTKLDAALKEYQSAQRSAMMNSFIGRPPTKAVKDSSKSNTPPPDPNAAPIPAGPQDFTPPTPDEIKTRMEEMTKLSEKARKTGGDKVLALLTPEQKAQWERGLGKPFTFRKTN